MRDFYIYGNPVLKEVYLQDGPNWRNRMRFDSVSELRDYINSGEPLARTIRERGKITLHVSRDVAPELNKPSSPKINFKKQPILHLGGPPSSRPAGHKKR